MDKKLVLAVFTFLLCIFFSCEKDETPVDPVGTTQEQPGDTTEESQADDTQASSTLFEEPVVAQAVAMDLEAQDILQQVQLLVEAIPDQETLVENIALLEEALEEEPGNVAILFSLTQYYNRAGYIDQEYQTILQIQEEEARGVAIPTTLQFLYGRADQIRNTMTEGLDAAALMEQIDNNIEGRLWAEATNLLNAGEELLQAPWVAERRAMIRQGFIDDTGYRIETNPSGASVIVAGEVLGTTPYQQMSVAVESLEVELQLIGYKSSTKLINISPGYLAEYEFDLQESIPISEVTVDGGSFLMGNAQGGSNERPVHSVSIDSFYMDKFEVSQSLWNRFMSNSSENQGESLPVENVTWLDAVLFCNALSEAQGLMPCYTFNDDESVTWNPDAAGFRLPTEAEWEWAARGGRLSQDFDYPGGNDSMAVAWYRDNSNGQTQAVGTKAANELGLHDMAGNVWEWCWDSYSNYSSDEQINPRGALTQPTASGDARVVRGGDWNSAESYLSSSARFLNSPQMKSPNLGFRVVRNIE